MIRTTLVCLCLASGLGLGATPQVLAHEALSAEVAATEARIETSGDEVHPGGRPDGHAPVGVMDHHMSQGGRPDGQAPIGVMGDHVHKKGRIMLSYRYMRMEMDGNRSGSDDISTADVLNRFMVAPTNMTMEMHMFGIMYGLVRSYR
jgi:hypothetical protein